MGFVSGGFTSPENERRLIRRGVSDSGRASREVNLGVGDQYGGVGDFSWVGSITVQQVLGGGEDCGTRRMRDGMRSSWTWSISSVVKGGHSGQDGFE